MSVHELVVKDPVQAGPENRQTLDDLMAAYDYEHDRDLGLLESDVIRGVESPTTKLAPVRKLAKAADAKVMRAADIQEIEEAVYGVPMPQWEADLTDRRNQRDKNIARRDAIAERCLPYLAGLALVAFAANTAVEAEAPDTTTMGVIRFKDCSIAPKYEVVTGEQSKAANLKTWQLINTIVDPLRVDMANPYNSAPNPRAALVRLHMGTSYTTYLPIGEVKTSDFNQIKEPKAIIATVKNGPLRYEVRANTDSDNVMTNISLRKYSVKPDSTHEEYIRFENIGHALTITGVFNDTVQVGKHMMAPFRFTFSTDPGNPHPFPTSEELAMLDVNIDRILNEMAALRPSNQ